jgi:hypothetical protein
MIGKCSWLHSAVVLALVGGGAPPAWAQSFSFSWSGFTSYWRSHLQTTAGITQLALIVAAISVLIIMSGRKRT